MTKWSLKKFVDPYGSYGPYELKMASIWTKLCFVSLCFLTVRLKWKMDLTVIACLLILIVFVIRQCLKERGIFDNKYYKSKNAY